jgi:citrate synthase
VKIINTRAKILKEIAAEVFDIMGRSKLIDVAVELERIALKDEYFIKVMLNLFNNVEKPLSQC